MLGGEGFQFFSKGGGVLILIPMETCSVCDFPGKAGAGFRTPHSWSAHGFVTLLVRAWWLGSFDPTCLALVFDGMRTI